MSLIQANGYLNGTACSTLSIMSVGTYFTLDNIDYQKVSVEATSPAAGKIFAHKLLTGEIVQLTNSLLPDKQAVGSWSFTSVSDIMQDPSEPSADTLGGLTVGTLCDTSVAPSTNGSCGRKVNVLDEDGVAISAGVNSSWILLFSSSEVASEPDSTQVESWGSSAAAAYKIQ